MNPDPLSHLLPLPGLPTIGLDPISGLGTSLSQSAATAVFDGFGGWLAAGASSLVHKVASLATATSPQLGTGFFQARFSTMLEVAGLVVAPLLGAATISAVAHQDLRRLGRAWGVALPIALVVGAGAVPFTQLGIEVTDSLSNIVWDSATADVGRVLAKIGDALATSIASGNAFLAVVISLVVIAGCFLVWLELLLRSAAIYMAVAFLPLALAGMVWPATAHWAKRAVELLVALVISKFVIVVALTIGIGAAGEAKDADQVLVGGAVLLMAGFAPFLVLKLAPVFEMAAVAHLEGAARRPVDAARQHVARALALPQHPAVALLSTLRAARQSVDQEAVNPLTLVRAGGELDREWAAHQAGAGGGEAPAGGPGPASASPAAGPLPAPTAAAAPLPGDGGGRLDG
ncbi:MAG: hypothetical protein ACRDY0_08145 [Acidimicrobiales bacterium]